jgi:hypothetical protein
MEKTYKYYKIGNRPFRACFEAHSVASYTESVDPESGELRFDMSLISKLDGDDTWELSEEDFRTAVVEYVEYMKEKKSILKPEI